MVHGNDVLAHLQRLIDDLRKEWYAAGQGDEFEQRIADYQQRGEWPFTNPNQPTTRPPDPHGDKSTDPPAALGEPGGPPDRSMFSASAPAGGRGLLLQTTTWPAP